MYNPYAQQQGDTEVNVQGGLAGGNSPADNSSPYTSATQAYDAPPQTNRLSHAYTPHQGLGGLGSSAYSSSSGSGFNGQAYGAQPMAGQFSQSMGGQYGQPMGSQYGHPNNMSQQQMPQQQQPGKPAPGQGNPMGFNNFFSDPAAQMGLQFGQSAISASQQYMQNNLQQLVGKEDIKYYFKVSNSYVMRKLRLIFFPYRNRTWIRQFRSSIDAQGNSLEVYATPIEDVNAPDLYIPSMAVVTYILLWAVFSGFKGDFHPQLLASAFTRTLAFYMLDVLLLKISFYALAISSKNSKMWDLISYSGYKYVTTLLVMILKNVVGSYFIQSVISLVLVFSLGFFLMRSLRYVVLPTGMDTGSISAASQRLRSQFLFFYSFVIQAVLIWLMA